MKIHDFARVGDLASLQGELRRGVLLDSVDDEGLSPLMVAVASPQAGLDFVRSLIDLGADVNAVAKPPPEPELGEEKALLREMEIEPSISRSKSPASAPSVLGHAVRYAALDKIELLLKSGANTAYVDPCGYSIVLNAMHRDDRDSPGSLRQILLWLSSAGAPLDVVSAYGESAVKAAYLRSDFSLLKLLLEQGGDLAPLRWNDLHRAVVWGSETEVRQQVRGPDSLTARDAFERTPLLLAVAAGRIEIAAAMVDLGADLHDRGRYGETAAMVAIFSNQISMLKWLIEEGANLEAADEWCEFPLSIAVSCGTVEAVRVLIEAGADVTRRDKHDSPLIHSADNAAVAQLLAEHGQPLNEMSSETRRHLLGHGDAILDLSGPRLQGDLVRRDLYRRLGRKNPERMNLPLWHQLVRTRISAYQAAKQVLGGEHSWAPEGQVVWCFERFGQSLSRLPDGRWVEIGGEHEDHYDPDFCIYNDVVVHQGDGRLDIFGYPEEIFPPTDFHTATVVGEAIYLIGNLGYPENRQGGFTPVFRLDTRKWTIQEVICSGDSPGWIHRHQARLLFPGKTESGQIEVSGGLIYQDENLLPNGQIFRLDVRRRHWTRSK